jgi:hypothetical protein
MVTEKKSKEAHRKAGSASPVEADMDANKKSRATQPKAKSASALVWTDHATKNPDLLWPFRMSCQSDSISALPLSCQSDVISALTLSCARLLLTHTKKG